ncbi:MAG: sigma-70 family RNA polymerase sigma factor [Cyclobacteriaceae bacterium]|nr:sigma-70 family RNA polymerase sigma factor [Cyclobacteriaceae bacterium]MDX5466773.1 sigma-70 family RNA polymerase sigma factor [Cyclobacteriaceae bacterium]
MQYQEDHYYIQQTRKGNLQSFGTLVEKHERKVFTLCLRMLKNQEESEEAAQDAFVKAYQHLHGFSGNSKFTTWLFRIAYNECLGRLRKRKNEFALVEELTEDMDPPAQWQDGLSELLRTEREKMIKESLEKLSAQEGAILTLFYLEEFSIKEISSVTAMTESNVKVTLHRGRKNLAILLQKSVHKDLIGIK